MSTHSNENHETNVPPSAADTHESAQASGTPTPSQSELEALLDDLVRLARGNDQRGTADLRAEVERRIEKAKSGLADAIDRAQAAGAEFTARAREGVAKGIDASRDAAVERPLSTLTLAALGGLVVGLIMGRR